MQHLADCTGSSAASTGPTAWPGQWTGPLWYHALAGVRHLVWDLGYGLDPADADKMGWGMIIGAPALTFLTIISI